MSESVTQARGTKWIYSPSVDMLVGCGAWSLPLLILAYAFDRSDLSMWAVSFYALALLFNYPHYMATIYRAYHTREDFNRYRVFTLYLTVLIALTLIAAHSSYRLVPWLFTIYITWSPWHYMGQNFGLAMMFIHRNGIRMERKDRNALWTAFVASYLMIFLSFHTNPSPDPYVLSLGLPTLLDVLRIPLLVIFLILSIWPLRKLVRSVGWRPMAAPIALVTTEFLWFVLPTVVELTTGIRIPQTRYSAGILALMHSAQYIWITSYYAKQEARATQSSDWKWQTYFTGLVIGGIALFVPGPWLASKVFGLDFSSSFLIFTAIVNIHHFILDGAVWKLRDNRIASLLMPVDKDVQPQKATPWKTHAGTAWRLAKVAAIGGLLILAGVDQVRYYLGIRDSSSSSLAMAASMNSHDSALKGRLAQAYTSAGQSNMAERALRDSIALNPYNTDTQDALARLLIQSQRYDDAYKHYQQMFIHVTPNAAELTNFGILASQEKHEDEAQISFEQAIQKDPNYAAAHLDLAEMQMSQGRTADAIGHYEQYLGLMTSGAAGVAANPGNILPAALKLAQGYTEAKEYDKAVSIYDKCITMAHQTGDRKVERLALAQTAQAQLEANHVPLAIAALQRALKLDSDLGDERTTALDWFHYGELLERSDASKRLALACYIQSEQLLRNTGDLAPVTATRRRLASSLGRDAETVRKKLDETLAEALKER